jgi:hypothetical protein
MTANCHFYDTELPILLHTFAISKPRTSLDTERGLWV